MIKLVVFAVAAICLAGSTTATSEITPQKMVFYLLEEPFSGDIIHPEVFKESKKFNFDEALKVWKDKESLTKFWHRYQAGFLPRDAIFSFNDPFHNQDLQLFRNALFSAPTDEFFFTFASWAREHLNRGVFATGFILVLTHRESTSHIDLPPLNWVYRHYFYPSYTIKEFNDERFFFISGYKNELRTHKTIWANFSSSYGNMLDYKLAYFYNDLDFNKNNFDQFIIRPYSVYNCEHSNSIIRSMDWLSYISFLVNRYKLELLSNGYYEIRDFSWHHPNIPPYTPSMQYENGVPFTQRYRLPYESSKFVKYCDEMITLEQIIHESVALKQLIKPDGKQSLINNTISAFSSLIDTVLGNCGSANVGLYKSYDQLGKKILGYSDRRDIYYKQFPSSLENPFTALRDPASYMFYWRIVEYFFQLKENLPPHTPKELSNNNLVISDFKVDEVTTYLEPYDSLIANVSVHDEIHSIKVRQMRLNHNHPKAYFNVKATAITKAKIKIFVGPAVKYPGTSEFQYYSQFYPIYINVKDLVVGNNKLVLDFEDNLVVSRNFDDHLLSTDEYYKKRQVSILPNHMIFPRGTCEGMDFKFYVYIEEYVQNEESHHQRLYSWPKALYDKNPVEYPFERPIENMTIPNMAEYYGKIFFKNDYKSYHAD